MDEHAGTFLAGHPERSEGPPTRSLTTQLIPCVLLASAVRFLSRDCGIGMTITQLPVRFAFIC